jgi:DNA-binding transcriptional regulator YiaG
LASESAAAGKEEVRVVNQGLDGDPTFRSKIMAKNFKELREKMSPESRERSRLLAAKYRAEMPLDELREAREMTQVHLARILKVNQAAVSKMERRADMYISTLQDFIKAMGGELKIIARFPDGTVEINQFESVKKAAVGS